MTSSSMPSFPPGLPETHLRRLPLSKLLSHDPNTEAELFEICKSQGFFYLDLTETPRGQFLLSAADHLQQVAKTAFQLPDVAKEAVSFAATKSLFGWKASGITAKDDPHKRTDVGQFWNVSKDDVLQNEGCKGVPYPSPLKEEIKDGDFKQFMVEAHSTGLLVLEALAKKLGLDAETMRSRHRMASLSGDHVRLTYGPGDPNATDELARSEADTRITTYGHTDFGTITLLFNWLGGLQIENGKTGAWEWVRPLPGHAIINLGDSMKEFSGKQLASGKHRVVAAPGSQARLERYSVVYFVRPEDEVYMEDLTERSNGTGTSTGQSNGTNGHTNGEAKKWKAGEWIIARAQNLGNKIK